jgi:hypothetical protein
LNAYKLIDRLKEPSTYGAISAALVAFGVSVPHFQLLATAASGVFAAVAAFLPELTAPGRSAETAK